MLLRVSEKDVSGASSEAGVSEFLENNYGRTSLCGSGQINIYIDTHIYTYIHIYHECLKLTQGVCDEMCFCKEPKE